MKRSKEDMFSELWVKYDYCMMGYDYDALFKSMTKKEIQDRLRYERASK